MKSLLHKLDEDDRPLGEQAVGARIRHERCPFSGPRKGRPMNASALEQVQRVWPEVLALIEAAAAREEATVLGAWRAASACLALAWETPEPLPRAVSALFKTTQGYHQAFTLLIVEFDQGATPLEALGGGEVFLAWCEREGLLEGREEVCAGPPGWIVRGFEAFGCREAGDFPLAEARCEAFREALIADMIRGQQRLAQGLEPEREMAWQLARRGLDAGAFERLRGSQRTRSG